MPVQHMQFKPCNGPLCEGRLHPRDAFYPRTKGSSYVTALCRECEMVRRAGQISEHGAILRSKVLWIFEELVGRCGSVRAAAARSGIDRMTLTYIMTGRSHRTSSAGVRRVMKFTVRKAMLALQELRAEGYSKSDAWAKVEDADVISLDPHTVDGSMKWARRNGLTFPTLEARMNAWRDWSELRRSGVDDLERVVMRYGGRIERRDPVGRDVLAEAS